MIFLLVPGEFIRFLERRGWVTLLKQFLVMERLRLRKLLVSFGDQVTYKAKRKIRKNFEIIP